MGAQGGEFCVFACFFDHTMKDISSYYVNLLPLMFQVARDRGYLPGYLTSLASFPSLTSNCCNFMCEPQEDPC